MTKGSFWPTAARLQFPLNDRSNLIPVVRPKVHCQAGDLIVAPKARFQVEHGANDRLHVEGMEAVLVKAQKKSPLYGHRQFGLSRFRPAVLESPCWLN